MKRYAILLVFALLTACSGPTTDPVDSGTVADVSDDAGDVGGGIDASTMPDQSFFDAGVDVGGADIGTGDTGPGDVGPTGPLGDITGACGELDTELGDALAYHFENAIDFGMDPYDDGDLERLTDGGQEIIADGNAGGSSLLSEVFAYEVLARCEGAVLLKTETEIAYVDPNGKLTDLLVEIDGTKIGVSVTRAVGFPRDDPYTVQQAETLLTDKLNDIEASSANVSADDMWEKQILHVLAYAPGHSDSLQTAFESLPADVVDDTIVWVTTTDGDDEFLY